MLQQQPATVHHVDRNDFGQKEKLQQGEKVIQPQRNPEDENQLQPSIIKNQPNNNNESTMSQQQSLLVRSLQQYHPEYSSSLRRYSAGLAAVVTGTAAVGCYYSYCCYDDDDRRRNHPYTGQLDAIRPWFHQTNSSLSNNIITSASSSWPLTTRAVNTAFPRTRSCHCDAPDSFSPIPTQPTATPTAAPSWWRRSLHWCRLASLPLPRYVLENDPDLQLAPQHQRQRRQDEQQIRKLQQRMQDYIQKQQAQQQNTATAMNNNKDHFQKTVADFVLQQYALMYGPHVTPEQRQAFVVRYGCTAWTPEVLRRLIQLGMGRGFVEIGAGHGQWAQALTEEVQRHRAEWKKQQEQQSEQTSSLIHAPRDFVLAYDDGSHLPLNPHVYHAQTQPHQAYFGQVLTTNSSDLAVILNHWRHRRRILLLVFPTASLAIQALRAYSSGDTLVYVGEGRGGANAGDDFFQFLQENHWILQELHDVQPFGTKGYERLFVFVKHEQEDNDNDKE